MPIETPVLPRVPVSVVGGNGVAASTAGGVLTVSIDLSAAPAMPAAVTDGLIPVFSPSTGTVYAYPLQTLLNLIAGAAQGADAPEVYMAGGTISGDTAVMFSSPGSVIPADPTAAQYVYAGIALGGVQAGAQVQVKMRGPVTSNVWAWTPEQPVFVGTPAGALTQTAPTSGRSQLVGWATGPQTIFLDPEEPITIQGS